MKLYAPGQMEPQPDTPETKEVQSKENRRGVADEIREQQKKAKAMSPREKFAYFWGYYKFHALAIVLVTICLVSFIHGILSKKEEAFCGIMLNASALDQNTVSASFAEYAGIDTETYDCSIDTQSHLTFSTMSEADMATSQKLTARIHTQELDAVVFDSLAFNLYGNNEVFADLRTLYSAEELAEYDLYYIDYAEIRRADADPNYENKNLIDFEDPTVFTTEAVTAEAGSHRHPEEMEDPIPVGIFMEQSPIVLKTYAYEQAVPVFGIIVNSQHIDPAKSFLTFLWDEEIAFDRMQVTY